jgi:tetratricopeptide (TPR) repeat protein
LDFGGYISWRNPDRRPFLDGRLEVLGPERLETYLQAHVNPAVWNRLQSSWGFEALLLEHSSRGNAAFLTALLESGEWQLKHLSAEAALLVPNRGPAAASRPSPEDWSRALEDQRGPEPHAGNALQSITGPIDSFLRRMQGSPRNAPVRRACRLANACLTLGWVEEARTGYQRVLEVSPRDSEALFNLGVCELRLGNRDAAREIWQRAVRLVRHADRHRFEEALSQT